MLLIGSLVLIAWCMLVLVGRGLGLGFMALGSKVGLEPLCYSVFNHHSCDSFLS